jgi:hypothetical protein
MAVSCENERDGKRTGNKRSEEGTDIDVINEKFL